MQYTKPRTRKILSESMLCEAIFYKILIAQFLFLLRNRLNHRDDRVGVERGSYLINLPLLFYCPLFRDREFLTNDTI